MPEKSARSSNAFGIPIRARTLLSLKVGSNLNRGRKISTLCGLSSRKVAETTHAYNKAGNLAYRTNNMFVQNVAVNNVNELTGQINGGKLTVVGTNALRYGDATFAVTNMP